MGNMLDDEGVLGTKSVAKKSGSARHFACEAPCRGMYGYNGSLNLKHLDS